MESKEIITDEQIKINLENNGWHETSVDEGRLMLVELLSKSGAGCYGSYTESGFLSAFKLTKKDRTPNKKGREFICSMVYKHSHNRPEIVNLALEHRV